MECAIWVHEKSFFYVSIPTKNLYVFNVALSSNETYAGQTPCRFLLVKTLMNQMWPFPPGILLGKQWSENSKSISAILFFLVFSGESKHIKCNTSWKCTLFDAHIWMSSQVAQMVKCLPATWETWVWSLGWEDPLEKEMATHSSTLAWKIPWTEEPGRLQSMGSQRVGHNWATSLSFFMFFLILGSAESVPQARMRLEHLPWGIPEHLSFHWEGKEFMIPSWLPSIAGLPRILGEFQLINAHFANAPAPQRADASSFSQVSFLGAMISKDSVRKIWI